VCPHQDDGTVPLSPSSVPLADVLTAFRQELDALCPKTSPHEDIGSTEIYAHVGISDVCNAKGNSPPGVVEDKS